MAQPLLQQPPSKRIAKRPSVAATKTSVGTPRIIVLSQQVAPSPASDELYANIPTRAQLKRGRPQRSLRRKMA